MSPRLFHLPAAGVYMKQPGEDLSQYLLKILPFLLKKTFWSVNVTSTECWVLVIMKKWGCDVFLVSLLPVFCRTCEVSLVGGPFLCFFLFFVFSPHYELFKTQTQFVVVTKELRVCWDFIQKDLRHLQRALQQRWGGERKDTYKGTALDSQKMQKTEQARKGKPLSGQKTTSYQNAYYCTSTITSISDRRRGHELPPVWLMLPLRLHTSTICLQFAQYEILLS